MENTTTTVLPEERSVEKGNAVQMPEMASLRGCPYRACRGMALGGLRDIAVITHGPVGCGYYSWGTLNVRAKAGEDGIDLSKYCFTTDMQQEDIIFGGGEKLRKAISEVVALFQPKAVFVCSTCPVAIIGDDIHKIADSSAKELGLPVLAFSCEGFRRGVGGPILALRGIAENLVVSTEQEADYPINIIGDYNIGGSVWKTKELLNKAGYHIVSVFTGDDTFDSLKSAGGAKLNIVLNDMRGRFVGDILKQKFGMDFITADFRGLSNIEASLRAIAVYFNDDKITQSTQRLISRERNDIDSALTHYRKIFSKKTVAVYTNGMGMSNWADLLKDIGFEIINVASKRTSPSSRGSNANSATFFIRANSVNAKRPYFNAQDVQREIRMPVAIYEKFRTILPENVETAHLPDGIVCLIGIDNNLIHSMIENIAPDIIFGEENDWHRELKNGRITGAYFEDSNQYTGYDGLLKFAGKLECAITSPVWKYIKMPTAVL